MATSLQTSSYAARAATTTFTSTTQVNKNGINATPSSHKTHTESVVVIEQYEARFVYVENRLTSVERCVNKSGNMLAKLLHHNGIELTDADDTEVSPFSPMEIEHQSQTNGGTKRTCPSSPGELSQPATTVGHHA